MAPRAAPLFLAIVVGSTVGTGAATIAGLDPARAFVGLLALVLPAFAGARTLFVLERRAAGELVEWRRWSAGGMSLFGAPLPALAAGLLAAGSLGLPPGALLAAAAVGALAALVPLRVGCLQSGCCGGRALAGVPLQLVEALACGGLAGALFLLPGGVRDGAALWSATAGYGAIRVALARRRSAPAHAGLALGLVALGSTALVCGWGGPAAGQVVDAAEAARAAAAALLPAACVALPAALLLRFVGCGLMLDPIPPSPWRRPPPPDFEIPDLTVSVVHTPALTVTFGCQLPLSRPAGPTSVRIELGPTLGPGAGSPIAVFDLPSVSNDGTNEVFRLDRQVTEGTYRARCLVSVGAARLSGECVGSVTGPGLRVAFRSDDMLGLTAVECFE